MKTMRIAAALCALMPGVALAQTAPSAPVVATETAPPSQEALVEARKVAARLLPPGVYKTVMSGSMQAITGSMGDALKAMPLRQIAELGGLTPAEAKALDKVNIEEVMAIYDPYWQRRQQLTMQAMFGAMGDFFTTMEPTLREAMARAYADHFTVAELTDLDRYFSTPTGAKYAARATTIMTDPAVMASMKDLMPKMMQQMPHFIEAAQKATAGLPPVRKLDTMTPAERAKLAKALGVDPSKLHDPKVTS